MIDKETFTMTPLYERLLNGDSKMPLGIRHFYIMRADQICRLQGYSDNSVKHLKALLKDLVDAGYLQEDWPPTRAMKAKYIYMLADKGAEYLGEIGVDIPESFRPSKETGKNYLHLQHDLEVNDIIISAALLRWHAPGYWLESFIHHRELRQNPYYTLWQGQQFGLVPDGFLDIRQTLNDGRQRRRALLLEHDRGTEERKQFKRKIRAYVAYLQAEGYRQQFGVSGITIIFTTFVGERRRDQMRAWTREELEHEAETISERFLFTAQQTPVDARLWLAPCWYSMFMEAQPVALLGEE